MPKRGLVFKFAAPTASEPAWVKLLRRMADDDAKNDFQIKPLTKRRRGLTKRP